MRPLSLFAGALALAMPALPATAEDGTISITGGCGDPTLRVDIPVDAPAPPADHDCCDRTACHAACERQKRQQRPR